MNLIRIMVTAIATALACCLAMPAMAKDEAKKISGAVSVLKAINATPKRGIPPMLINEAAGIAIFPGAAKLDFMTKGRHATGILLTQDDEGNWSDPVFVNLSGGTIGWQAVGEPMDIVLLFNDSELVDRILNGKLVMKTDVKVGMGPIGQSLKGATDAELAVDVFSYTRSRGELGEAVLAGSILQLNAAANAAFYGKAKVSAEEIVSGAVEKPTPDLTSLRKILGSYAGKK
jgi:lipid-binding SYLF domain-containing protein